MNLVLQLGPFVLLLLAIALTPLLSEAFWHRNRNKALVTFALALPSVVWLLAQGRPGVALLLHALGEYAQFILLLTTLYAVSGVVVIHGSLPGRPWANTLWLALGAVLANPLGTTGASMLLLRPLLRANHHRRRNGHVPVFFTFVVSNCGGLLLPLGDPPLLLGFLEGVDFFWTLRLWPQWLLVNGLILLVFYVWDARAGGDPVPGAGVRQPRALRVEGLGLGGLVLAGTTAVLLLQAPPAARAVGELLRRVVAGAPDPLLPSWAATLALAALAGGAGLAAHRPWREARAVVWAPLVEVAVLFAGLFVTMAPALQLLAGLPALAWTEARLLWAAGGLSGFLDNAPTYLSFATLADPGGPAALAQNRPGLLRAVSCGAVWMGSLTYIGNGPNFLVRGIAEHTGYRMPSFFGYLLYSLPVLLPVFALATLLFFG